jgi:hypothetical protein
MPSSSAKQHRFMEAIAHNKAFAKKAGVPQSVGEDFSNADKGKTFKQGGHMKEKAKEAKEAKQLRHLADEEEREAHAMKHGGKVKKMAIGGPGMDPRLAALMAAKRGGSRRPMVDHEPVAAPMGAPMGGMKHGGKVKKMAKGGETIGPRNMSHDVEKGSNKLEKFGESAVQKRGHTRGHNLGDDGKKVLPKEEAMKKGGKLHKFAKGGHVGSEAHHRADGIARKGHTRTKIC